MLTTGPALVHHHSQLGAADQPAAVGSYGGAGQPLKQLIQARWEAPHWYKLLS